MGRHHHDRRLRRARVRRVAGGGARTLDGARPWQGARGLRLPHDAARGGRPGAGGHGRSRRGGSDLVQALHGLSRRLSGRRPGAVPGDDPGRRARWPDRPARRERRGDRPPRRATGRGRPDGSRRARAQPTAGAGGRGDRAGHRPGRAGRRAGAHRAPVVGGRPRGGAGGARPRGRGARRDLSAVPLPQRGRPAPARRRGRGLRLLTAAATGRAPDAALARPAPRRPRDRRHRPLPVHRGAEGRLRRLLPADPERPAGRGGAGDAAARGRRPRGARSEPVGRGHGDGPARLFGLYPRKGTIAAGSDADLVVFDPAHERTLSAADQHGAVDYSCYEGLRVHGLPEVVMQRGHVLVEGGRFHGSPGTGRYLPRTPGPPA